MILDRHGKPIEASEGGCPHCGASEKSVREESGFGGYTFVICLECQEEIDPKTWGDRYALQSTS